VARGWGSKDVESQRENWEKAVKVRAARSAKDDLQQKRDALQMQRARIQRELQTTSNARFHSQLEASLKHLDDELAQLGGDASSAAGQA
jgi:hypothetical protein